MKKRIPNSRYSISDTGEVVNEKTGRVMSQRVNFRGYKIVGIIIEGKQRTFSVHRLVGEAFIPNPMNNPQIDHRDEDKTNNKVSNLRWCTHLQNMEYYHKKQCVKGGKKPDMTMDEYINSVGESMIVNGIRYPSVRAASKYIAESENKNPETIRKEIARRHIRDGHMWSMYGKYNIGW